MAPTRRHRPRRDRLIPKELAPELLAVDDFVQIRQIEEWRLLPDRRGDHRHLSGTVTVRREPVDPKDAEQFPPFQIEYDAKVKLSEKTLDLDF